MAAAKEFVPLIAITKLTQHTRSLPPRDRAKALESSMTRKLQALARVHEERDESCLPHENKHAHKSAPTLNGILICASVVAFVTFAPSSTCKSQAESQSVTPQLRSHAVFDLGQRGQDVWNGFAIALLVMGARNRVMASLEERDSLEERFESSGLDEAHQRLEKKGVKRRTEGEEREQGFKRRKVFIQEDVRVDVDA